MNRPSPLLPADPSATRETITLVTPVFNDWASLLKLVKEIDRNLDPGSYSAKVIAVDDGSLEPCPDLEKALDPMETVVQVEILRLTRNLGHQRAIAIGLSHAVREHKPDRIVVMDSDGEDRPDTLSGLLGESRATGRIVFASRSKRRESAIFLFFYGLYRLLFQILTGKPIAFGNFCVLPGELAGRAVLLPDIWNHFAAGIMRSRLPQTTLRVPRGSRYFGASRMKFTDLVMHGLSAISVYSDILAVRLIVFTSVVIAGAILGGISLLYVRLFTDLAIPGWATTVAFGLAIILFQAFMFLTLVSFLILGSRNARMVMPIRHYRDYLLGAGTIHGRI